MARSDLITLAVIGGVVLIGGYYYIKHKDELTQPGGLLDFSSLLNPEEGTLEGGEVADQGGELPSQMPGIGELGQFGNRIASDIQGGLGSLGGPRSLQTGVGDPFMDSGVNPIMAGGQGVSTGRDACSKISEIFGKMGMSVPAGTCPETTYTNQYGQPYIYSYDQADNMSPQMGRISQPSYQQPSYGAGYQPTGDSVLDEGAQYGGGAYPEVAPSPTPAPAPVTQSIPKSTPRVVPTTTSPIKTIKPSVVPISKPSTKLVSRFRHPIRPIRRTPAVRRSTKPVCPPNRIKICAPFKNASPLTYRACCNPPKPRKVVKIGGGR